MDKEFIIIGIGCVAMAGYEIRYDLVTSGIGRNQSCARDGFNRLGVKLGDHAASNNANFKGKFYHGRSIACGSHW